MLPSASVAAQATRIKCRKMFQAHPTHRGPMAQFIMILLKQQVACSRRIRLTGMS
jgi:hypothetical protein